MSGALSSALLASCTSKPTDSSEASATKADSVDKKVSARPAHGGYEGEDGPQAWATLSPAYAFCGTGQSPVNFVKTDARGGATWRLDYKSTSLRIAHNEHMEDIIDNGHTIQITVDEGSAFTFAGKHYHLKQFHFHTPGEHTLDGQHAPMEIHVVHQADNGTPAVVGVLFQEGTTPNPNFEKIIANLPSAKGESKHITDVN